MKALDQLASVLCDPAGKCNITGSDADRAIVDEALAALRATPATAAEPVAWTWDTASAAFGANVFSAHFQFEKPESDAAILRLTPLYANPVGVGARTIEDCPELNMRNFTDVDVEHLNDWAIRADAEIDRLAAIRQPASETTGIAPKDCLWARNGNAHCQLTEPASEGQQAEGAVPMKPAAWVLFRKDEDGLEPVTFYGGSEKPQGEFKDKFELHEVWTRPVPSDAGRLEIIQKLRDASNWLKQGFGNWKDTTSRYDRTPFEAADLLEAIYVGAKPRGWFWSDGRESGVCTVAQDYEDMKAKYPRMEFEPFYSMPALTKTNQQAKDKP